MSDMILLSQATDNSGVMEGVLGLVYYNRLGYGAELMDCDV